MPNRLNLPEDLSSLIEKRESEDRRQNETNHEKHASESGSQEKNDFVDRRSGNERRTEQ